MRTGHVAVICERKKWATEALRFNTLVTSWEDLAGHAPVHVSGQTALDFDADAGEPGGDGRTAAAARHARGVTYSGPVATAQARGADARWRKVALQVNPFGYVGKGAPSTRYTSEAEYNRAIVDACVEQHIALIGITDHWCARSGQALAEEARDAGVRALLGFEAKSREGIHIVVLFSDRDSIDDIHHAISSAGAQPCKGAKQEGHDLDDMLVELTACGGLLVAAHVNGPNGLLTSLDAGSSTAHFWANPLLTAVAVQPDISELQDKILHGRLPDYPREHLPALLHAADVCNPSRLADTDAVTWVKMHDVGWEGLATAFRTPETRVALTDPAEERVPRIVSATWTGGFLDGLGVRLSESLTTVIGPRGAGKSVFIESLRHALGLAALGQHAAADHASIVRDRLGSGTEIALVVDGGPLPSEYVITRNDRDRPVVHRADTGRTEQLRPADVLPDVQIYSQHELAELADDRDHLARLVGGLTPDYVDALARVTNVQQELARNREQLVAVMGQQHLAAERLADRPRLEAQLQAYDQADVTRLDAETALTAEQQRFPAAHERLYEVASSAAELLALTVTPSTAAGSTDETSARAAALAELTAALSAVDQALTDAAAAVSAAVPQARARVDAAAEHWAELSAPDRASFDAVKRELAAAGLKPDQYLAVRSALTALAPVEGLAGQLADRRASLDQERRGLLSALSAAAARTRQALAAGTTEANNRLDGTVRLRPLASEDRSTLLALADTVRGSQKQLKAAIMSADCNPGRLAETARHGADALSAAFGFSPAQSQAIVAAGEELALKMEEQVVAQAVETSLNVGGAGRTEWRELERLSKGQRATALLLLLLSSGSGPLIIDQPEDDLDNRFIVNGVVPRLRALKGHRQLILATHNANIPVLGDADLVVTLEGTPDHGEIATGGLGSIDDPSVRGHIEQLLEGGKRAFRRAPLPLRLLTVTPFELSGLLLGGEDSVVEFKRDDINPEMLAKELVALANLNGGVILLGVEDDGAISGVTREDVDEWVMTIARDKVRPPLIPSVESLLDPATGQRVVALRVERGYAVHAVWHHNHFTFYVRAGKQSREVTPEEMPRLQQQRGVLRGELRALGAAGLASLDLRRLQDYFGRVRGQEAPSLADVEAWERLLRLTEIMVDGDRGPVCTLAGFVLFGEPSARSLPISRIDATIHPTPEKGYAALDRRSLSGPLVPLRDGAGEVIESGVIDAALGFVRSAVGVSAELSGARRVDTPGFPLEPLREGVVNAVMHRDYTLVGSDVELGVYPDRIEIISPGRLPNGLTVEGMLAGVRVARNELIKDVLRDYDYAEHLGLGVPRKIVAGMQAYNGTSPDYDLSLPERVRLVLQR